MPAHERYDAVIVGGGHNGLVAAAYLARAGRSVLVLERLGSTGGAAVSSRPFAGLEARLSRYSYLVSLLPRKIVRDLGLELTLRKRSVSSYTPVRRDGRATGLLVDDRADATRRQSFERLTHGTAEYRAWEDFYGMTRRVAERVFPTLTEPLPTREELRRRVDDDDDSCLAHPVRGAARCRRRGVLPRRPGARRRPHGRADRDLRGRPRPVPEAEPVLPLPRDRQRHRRLGRPRRRHGAAHGHAGRSSAVGRRVRSSPPATR